MTAKSRNPNRYVPETPLPRVQCPATLGLTCGGKSVPVVPLHDAVNKGKIRDHKPAPLREKRRRGDRSHGLVLCPGSGRIVTIDAEDDIQLELDFGTEDYQDYQEPTLLKAAQEVEAE